MSADDRQQPAPPAWRHTGVGHSMTFRCGACNKPKGTVGRRLQRVLGLRTYVCAQCVVKP